jgi:hypothetical protein
MTEYIYNQSGDFSISIIDKELSTEEKNMAKLAAGLGFNRYTKRLKAIEDLSKITYIYGTRDEQVGPLSDEEIKFLESKKVQIGKNDGANHDQTIQAGASLIKALFGI